MIMRGHQQKRIRALRFERLVFDTVEKKLYAFRREGKGSIIVDEWDLNAIERLWLTNTSDSTIDIVKEKHALLTEENITDILIIDGQMYSIHNNRIYKRSLDELSREKEFVTEISADKFPFLLFCHQSANVTKVKMNGVNSHYTLMLLALIDMIIMYAFYMIYKKLKLLNKSIVVE
jgi:hypothetical protein